MAIARFLHKTLAPLALAALVAGCSASGEDVGAMRAELGDFQLCYNIVTTNDAVQGPLSREADVEAFAAEIRTEIDRRLGRYQGGRLYHLALHLDAYVLAVPGIPIVASPRSALIVSANLWDDRLGRPLNAQPEQFTILESAGGSSIVGSGLSLSAEEQMTMLSQNAALRLETWLAEHPEWFTRAEEIPETRETTGATPLPTPAAAPVGQAPAGAVPEATQNTCGHR